MMISFIRIKKSYSSLLGTMWKNNCVLNLKTGCAALCSKNCTHTFALTGKESFTLLWMNSNLLFFAELFEFSNSEWFFEHLSSCQSTSITPQHLGDSKNIIWGFLFSHSEFLLMCFGSLSCSITRVSLRPQTDGQIFRIFGVVKVLKQQEGPNHHSTSTMFVS